MGEVYRATDPRLGRGLEDLAGSSAIVMELVDGPSLGDLIARGPLGLVPAAVVGGVCDRLMQKRSTCRSSSPLRTSGDNDDGPRVQRIIAFWEWLALVAKIGVAEQRPTPTNAVAEPPPGELARDDRGHDE